MLKTGSANMCGKYILKEMQLYVWQNYVVVYTVHDRVAKK